MDDIKIVIDRMKKLRKEKGYSERELAEMTGISKSTIAKYECYKVNDIPASKIEKIATALGVDPLWLMGYDERGEIKRQISEIVDSLSGERAREALRYLRFLAESDTGENQ